MKKKIASLALLAAALLGAARAQAQVSSVPAPGATATPVGGRTARSTGPVEVNILGSYYQQDGNNAAATGGLGTEYLTDITPTLIVNVPLDSVSRVTANIGADFYASASTDRINEVLSSPSSHDSRKHADLAYARQFGHNTVGLGGGFSTEYDYTSVNVLASWARDLADGSAQIGLTGQMYFDQAAIDRKFLPVEIRQNANRFLPASGKRRSYNLTATYAQLLTRRVQAALAGELVYQQGWLSTIFHRVYFRDSPESEKMNFGDNIPNPLVQDNGYLPRIENLPDSRLKYPVSLRVNWFATDLIILRGFYRYYADNWGMRGNTVELEAPLKVGTFFTLYPLYRFSQQTAADYFAPFGQHSVNDEFYTSDYDLSGFTSQKFGAGIRWSPLEGLANFSLPLQKGKTQFKGIDLRYAHYQRSTGFTANIVSLDLSFVAP